MSEVQTLETQSGDLKQVLNDNIHHAIERNDDLDVLSETADNIQESSEQFLREAHNLERKKCLQYSRAKAMYISVVFLLLVICILIIWKLATTKPRK